MLYLLPDIFLKTDRCRDEIKRVVVTSSLGAVVDLATPDGNYTEEDWNESSLKAVEEKGSEAGVMDVYSASKVHAERGMSIDPHEQS